MNKALIALLGLVAAVIAGYLVLQQAPVAVENETDAAGDTMLAGEEMDPENDLIGGDAAPGEEEPEITDDESASDEAQKEMEPSTDAAYLDFETSVIGNGETSLLFFHAPWCPNCRQAEKDLVSIYLGKDATISTYKVDYDSSTELKSRYGVTYQHTFVLIDGQGNAIKTVQGPSASALAAIVKG